MNISSVLTGFFHIPYQKACINPFRSIHNLFQRSVGDYIRDEFFMPLMSKKLPPNAKSLIEKETDLARNFWDETKPEHPHLPMHKEIRELFTKDAQILSLDLDGKPLEVKTSFFHLKNPSSEKPPVTMVYFLGNLSTCDMNIIDIYPFLLSYVKEWKKDPSIPPIQIFTVSQYDTSFQGDTYKPKTMEEAGKIAIKTLEKISEEYGNVCQATAFSLGTIILSAGLPYAAREQINLPSHLYFDRGPSSVEKASSRFGLFGKVLVLLAGYSGWNIDLGKNISESLVGRTGQSVILSNVEQDHYFENNALVDSPYLKDLSEKEGFYKVTFDFPRQLYTKTSHHGLHNGLLDGYHLTSKNFHVLGKEENMAQKIVQALTKSQSVFQEKQSFLSNFFKSTREIANKLINR